MIRAICLPMIPLMTQRGKDQQLAHLSSSTDLLLTKLREHGQMADSSLCWSMCLLQKQRVEDGQSTYLISCRLPKLMRAKQQEEGRPNLVFCWSADLLMSKLWEH